MAIYLLSFDGIDFPFWAAARSGGAGRRLSVWPPPAYGDCCKSPVCTTNANSMQGVSECESVVFCGADAKTSLSLWCYSSHPTMGG